MINTSKSVSALVVAALILVSTCQAATIPAATTTDRAEVLTKAPKSIGYDPTTNTFYGYKIGVKDAFGDPGLQFIDDKSLTAGAKSIRAIKDDGHKYLFRCAAPKELQIKSSDTGITDRRLQFQEQCATRYFDKGDYTAQEAAGCPMIHALTNDPSCYGDLERDAPMNLSQAVNKFKTNPQEFEDIFEQIKNGIQIIDSLKWYYHITDENVIVYKDKTKYKVQFTHVESAVPRSVLRNTYKSSAYNAWIEKQNKVTSDLYERIYKLLYPKDTSQETELKVQNALKSIISTNTSKVFGKLNKLAKAVKG
ncbi:hypothetical protein BDF19DRAFT_413480 [Syncephalis fuscata]|nr:hypothetical protein BDF19DRAFT_413480 [Syncephalis fuscata]